MLALPAALVVELWGHMSTGLTCGQRPRRDGGDGPFLQMQIIAPVAVIGCFVLARLFTGHIETGGGRDRQSEAALALHRRPGTAGLLLVHGFPRVIA